MKAIVYHKYGSPDVLGYLEVEKPTAKDNEVLIKVHATSVNSWDWDLLRGTPILARIGGFLKPQFNILGADIAGRVEAVGRDVKLLQPGDEVYGDISGCGWGGFAEYVCVPEHALALKPIHLSFDEVAAVPQAAVLAFQGLHYRGQILSGHKVLINGAGGGVGTFAVQIAKSYGAEVTAVDSSLKLEMLRSIGADYVIDYKQEDYTKNGQRYELILDVVGRHSIFDSRRALSHNGTYVMVGGTTPRIFQAMLLGPLISSKSNKKIGILFHRPSKQDLDVLRELLDSGRVVPIVDRRYPLSEVADAIRYYGEGNVQGKVVITVSSSSIVDQV